MDRDMARLLDWFNENKLLSNQVYSRFKTLEDEMRCAHRGPAGTRVVFLASNRVLDKEDTLVEFKYPAIQIQTLQHWIGIVPNASSIGPNLPSETSVASMWPLRKKL